MIPVLVLKNEYDRQGDGQRERETETEIDRNPVSTSCITLLRHINKCKDFFLSEHGVIQ